MLAENAGAGIYQKGGRTVDERLDDSLPDAERDQMSDSVEVFPSFHFELCIFTRLVAGHHWLCAARTPHTPDGQAEDRASWLVADA